mmetsp:Transcript_90034/g.226514  ORF Transcript_90034/g.226514 Transcript_90034/m.226514 type:complete len:581 (+) Transcript_90034:167-1909(+)
MATATQLTITIPDGAVPGSILSVPVKGRTDTVKVRVPDGLGPGGTLVLTQKEGSDDWSQEVIPGEEGRALPQFGDDDDVPEPDPSLVPDGPVAYTVRLETTVGVIDIIVRPDWAPHGARRFLEMVAAGDLDGLAFYRAVKGCLAQFGLPAKRQWPPLPDDKPTGVPFLLGAVCFAAVGKNSRKSTLFICIGDMSHCFGQSPWETPIGAVAEGSLDALDRIETVYGDIAECGGAGPDTGRIGQDGDEYLQANFPLLTYINSARPLDWPPPAEEKEVCQTAPPYQASPEGLAYEDLAYQPQAAQATTMAAETIPVAQIVQFPQSGYGVAEQLQRTAPNPSGIFVSGPQQTQKRQMPQLTIDVPVEVVPSAATTSVPSYRSSANVQDVRVEVRRRPRQTAPIQQVPAVPLGSVSSMAWGSSLACQPSTPSAARTAVQVRSGSPIVSSWAPTPQRLAHPLPTYEQHAQANMRLSHQQPQSPTSGRSLSFTPAPKVAPQVGPPSPWPSGRPSGHPQLLPQGPCLPQQVPALQRPWPQPPPLGALGGFVSPPVAPPSPSPMAMQGLACPSPLSVPGLSSPMPWPIH